MSLEGQWVQGEHFLADAWASLYSGLLKSQGQANMLDQGSSFPSWAP